MRVIKYYDDDDDDDNLMIIVYTIMTRITDTASIVQNGFDILHFHVTTCTTSCLRACQNAVYNLVPPVVPTSERTACSVREGIPPEPT